MPVIVLAWLIAAAVRITQGSATVAMITAAGILSHVNDSGFWLVNCFFGMSEKDTLKSWTVMATIIAVMGLLLSLALSLFV